MRSKRLLHTLWKSGFRAVILLPPLAGGCAEYRFAFDCESRINTAAEGGGDVLDIDIVYLEPNDLAGEPPGELTAERWFAYKRAHGGRTLLPADRVASVTELRGSDAEPGVREVVVRYKPGPVEGTTVVLLADFAGDDRPPIVPPHQFKLPAHPWGRRDYVVRVGAERMDVHPGPYRGPRTITGK